MARDEIKADDIDLRMFQMGDETLWGLADSENDHTAFIAKLVLRQRLKEAREALAAAPHETGEG